MVEISRFDLLRVRAMALLIDAWREDQKLVGSGYYPESADDRDHFSRLGINARFDAPSEATRKFFEKFLEGKTDGEADEALRGWLETGLYPGVQLVQGFVNLTPHEINIYDESGEKLLLTLRPSGQVARIDSAKVHAASVVVNRMPIFTTELGEPIDLPNPIDGTVFVVSLIIKERMKRPDLYVPGELIRHPKDHSDPTLAGQPKGCKGLSW